MCIACGIATANPDAHLVAERGEEADIELIGDASDVWEEPVLRARRTIHLELRQSVLCATCAEVWRVECQLAGAVAPVVQGV